MLRSRIKGSAPRHRRERAQITMTSASPALLHQLHHTMAHLISMRSPAPGAAVAADRTVCDQVPCCRYLVATTEPTTRFGLCNVMNFTIYDKTYRHFPALESTALVSAVKLTSDSYFIQVYRHLLSRSFKEAHQRDPDDRR